MQWLNTLDVMIVQLILIPAIVIAFAVFFAKITGRIFIGPLLTLIFSLEINYWYFSSVFPGANVSAMLVATWAILFPLLALYFSWIAVAQPSKQDIKSFY